MSLKKIIPGSFLIAGPNLFDPNFRRTVVLLCEHTPEGSLGLVVNRPTPVTIENVIPNLSLAGKSADPITGLGPAGTIYCGGPVEAKRLMVVRIGESFLLDQEDQPVCEGVSLVADVAGTLEEIKNEKGALKAYRFFLGYSGWGKGQLAAEMKEGAWILRPPQPGLLFETDPAKLWSAAMEELGGDYRVYAQMPHDPSLN